MLTLVAVVLVLAGSVVSSTRAADNTALAERLASGVLRWGGDAEGGAPFQLRDPLDPRRVIGFEVEIADGLANALGKQLGKPIRAEFMQYEWGSLVPGLDKRDFDMILAGLEITPERRAQLRFSRPYYIYRQQLAVRRDEQRITSLEDCLNMTVGTLSGSAADRLLKSRGIRQIVGFDGQIEPFLDLEIGRLDAVLLDNTITTFFAEPNPKLKLTGPTLGRGEYGIGMRQEDAVLAEAIDAGLHELMVSGQLRDIYRRWHLWNADQSGLANGADRNAELAGLGFTAERKPLPESQFPTVKQVDRNLLAASADDWTFDKYAPLLGAGAVMTIFLTFTSMALAMTIGLVLTLARLYGPAPLRYLALGYVEFFRGVPLLLVLFFMYFGLTHYGLQLPAVATAILAFGMNYAAYESEIYRSAIQSVSPGQWEAGRALGMDDTSVFRRIIFPQAIRTALGPMTNDMVALFKDTSLVSAIAVHELTEEYRVLSRSSLKFVELGLLTAALYLAMSLPLGYLSRALERRWGQGH
ncbi:MAG: ABC transporter permease subunit [Planctomycetes bacterium]|nr:ABC transporter permease subunit [Planctomycetota bacterium]